MMQRNKILDWLRETDPTRLEDLWQLADRTRQECVGGEVHLRGLIELSNYCVRLCGYCGLRAGNQSLQRYRMSDEEIKDSVRLALGFGHGTVVLQSGEDPELTLGRMADLIRWIKFETPLAVTLSLGERSDEDLATWREAGADRYLLRFETSNRELYDSIHPPRMPTRQSERQECSPHHDRIAILETLRRLGYEVGSGVMIGIPGQTYEDLADDLELFVRLDLDMIGVGPFLRHPDTPLGDRRSWFEAAEGMQVPSSEMMTYKVIALARLMCPGANIPATTALATLNARNGRELGLVRGANVVMPNLTPAKYRALYEIYPNKACIAETGEACHHCLSDRIAKLGRVRGQGKGNSANYESRAGAIPAPRK
jgi:biotin synthase